MIQLKDTDVQLAISLSLADLAEGPSRLDPTSVLNPAQYDPSFTDLLQRPEANLALFQAFLAHQDLLFDPPLISPNPDPSLDPQNPLLTPLPTYQFIPPFPPSLTPLPPTTHNTFPPDLTTLPGELVHFLNLTSHPSTLLGINQLSDLLGAGDTPIPQMGSLATLAIQFQELRLRKRLQEALDESCRLVKKQRHHYEDVLSSPPPNLPSHPLLVPDAPNLQLNRWLLEVGAVVAAHVEDRWLTLLSTHLLPW